MIAEPQLGRIVGSVPIDRAQCRNFPTPRVISRRWLAPSSPGRRVVDHRRRRPWRRVL